MEPGVPARGEMRSVAADRFATAGDGGLQNFHFAGRAREEMVEHSPSTVIVTVVVDRRHRRRWRAHGESVRRANGACPHTPNILAFVQSKGGQDVVQMLTKIWQK
jgi:hypothetical protein